MIIYVKIYYTCKKIKAFKDYKYDLLQLLLISQKR